MCDHSNYIACWVILKNKTDDNGPNDPKWFFRLLYEVYLEITYYFLLSFCFRFFRIYTSQKNKKTIIFFCFCSQEKDEHLELLEGMLIDLLKTKWNTFVKFRFYRQFFLFFCYFLVSLVCFTLRPGPPDRSLNATVVNTTIGSGNDTELPDVGM